MLLQFDVEPLIGDLPPEVAVGVGEDLPRRHSQAVCGFSAQIRASSGFSWGKRSDIDVCCFTVRRRRREVQKKWREEQKPYGLRVH